MTRHQRQALRRTLPRVPHRPCHRHADGDHDRSASLRYCPAERRRTDHGLRGSPRRGLAQGDPLELRAAGSLPAAGAPTPVTQPGAPPDVDVYIDDGRNGCYEPYLADVGALARRVEPRRRRWRDSQPRSGCWSNELPLRARPQSRHANGPESHREGVPRQARHCRCSGQVTGHRPPLRARRAPTSHPVPAPSSGRSRGLRRNRVRSRSSPVPRQRATTATQTLSTDRSLTSGWCLTTTTSRNAT